MEEKTDKPLIEQALQDEVKEFAMLKDHKAGLEITLGSCTMPLQNIAGLLIEIKKMWEQKDKEKNGGSYLG